ncbi:MAG: L-threonylcarbamoyladenylate synthase [Burkholderiaceae bacterium]|jgi:tRNA threonylcarbamoyl adenosine modification protein (Sua5/YciO/YrdC/YwlC family)
MSQYFVIHPDNPQPRLVRQAVEIVRKGGVIAVPTDSCYALCCHLDDREAVMRLRRVRQVDEKHHLTLLCRDLSEIAQYAQIDNRQYRLLKATTPGPYTFILQATREVPKRLSHPSRKTIGLRVPENAIARALLEDLGQPLLGTTLILPGQTEPLTSGWEIREQLESVLDLVIDGGACGLEPTSVIDLTGEAPALIRSGRGSLQPFGFLDNSGAGTPG